MKCPQCDTENTPDSRFCKKCATALPFSEPAPAPRTETLKTPVKELTTGSTFAGRYQIIEELGKGGMGRVYKVFDTKIKEKIALKLLRPEVGADRDTLERFSQELKFARKIAHRNVCKMYDLGETDEASFITMEYVHGEDLKRLIRQMGQLSVGQAISIARQVCEGLAEAHRLGIVHRDLKPQNIMIDEEGNARIMDFGIARSMKAKGITGAGVIIGTPEYMSPEQVEGKDTDSRTDIYSLGVILYEMLTGRVPFEGDTPFTIGVKHKSEIPTNPAEINAQIPDELGRLILRCLEKDKGKRFQSADDMLSELAKIGKGIPAPEKLLPKRKTSTSKDITVTVRKRWVFVAAVVAVAVLAAIAFLLFRGVEKPTDIAAKKNKMIVVLPFENLGSPEDEYFADGMTDEITNRLSALYGLDLISGASAAKYKKTNKTIKQIREELGVDYVMTGTVRWDKSAEGKGLTRVTPQLIRASDDIQIWTRTYEQPIQDIFRVQSSIAEEVTKQLDITLLEPERKALMARPTENVEAYDLALRAIDVWEKAYSARDLKGLIQAIEMVEKAIEMDPNFVYAYTRLSLCHSSLYGVSGLDRTKERLAKSKAAVDKALELQPDLPEAKRALAYYYYRGFRDYDKALELFEDVQKARPNMGPTLIGYIQRRQGKWNESQATLEQAFKLNPRNEDMAYQIGLSLLSVRKYGEAEVWLDRSLSLDPEYIPPKTAKVLVSYIQKGNQAEAWDILKTFPPGRSADEMWFTLKFMDRGYNAIVDRLESPSSYKGRNKDLDLAMVFYLQKEYSRMKSRAEAALESCEKIAREQPENPQNHSSLGLVYAYLGRKDDALREANQAVNLLPVSKDAFEGPEYVMYLAMILTILGDYGKAIDQLDYLLSIPAGRFVSIDSLHKDPAWDALCDLPRFKQMLEKYSKSPQNLK